MSKRSMTFFSKAGLLRRWLVLLAGMLCSSSALALSYFIADGYGNDPAGMCQAVRTALAEGMVLDAERPLCERRFELSPKAKSLGLSSIEKTLLPTSSYPALMLRMFQIIGHESSPPSDADRSKDEKNIAQYTKDGDTKIYTSRFDADNSGNIHKVYVLDTTSCETQDSYWDGSVSTFIEKNDGSLDSLWGVYDRTAGIPFIYKKHTYYMKWESLNGNPNKKMLAQLDIYDSGPFDQKFKDIIPYQVFTPPYCEIYTYQTK